MSFLDRTSAGEAIIANERRAESPALQYPEKIADFLPAPIGPGIKLLTRLTEKRLENLEYLHECMRDDLREVAEKVEQQASKQTDFYREEIPALLTNGYQRAETMLSKSKIKRIGAILIHALVSGPECAPENTEDMLRVAAELDDLDVEILRQIVTIQGPRMAADQDSLGMNVVNPLWKDHGPTVAGLSFGDPTSICHKLESFGLITRVDKRLDSFGPDEPAPPFGLLRKGLRFVEFAIRGATAEAE